MKKKVVIAGAAGFVGKNLVDLLVSRSDCYELIFIDISNGVDLTDREQISQIGSFDVFVHLANLSYVPDSFVRPEQFYRVNFLTTLNALELCRIYQARLVYISSYIYGTPEYLPVDEKHPVSPFNPYAQSKFICESLCEGYYRDFGVVSTILRPFNIYGAGQYGKLLIPEIVSQLKAGNIINLKDPNPRRDYVNVKDVVRAIEMSIEHKFTTLEKFNVCSGVSYSVKELSEMFKSLMGNKVEFTFSVSDRKNEVNETKGSYEKLYKATGWKPSIEILDGLSDILIFENMLNG